jgi:hypothetical protein
VTADGLGACQAAVPVAEGEDEQVRATVWAECGEPATAVHEYRCEFGHARRGATCAAHSPVTGQVGCRDCYSEGREVPMAVTTERPR